jgi:hypothetical protein
MGLRTILLSLIILTSFGCASFPKDPYWQAEAGWQTLHAIDVLQTINGPAKDDCFVEANSITKSFIGEKPNTGEVLVWGVASGAAHWGVTKLLDRYNAKPWVKTAWQSVTIVVVADTVVDNHRIGIRPWGNNASVCNGLSGIDRIAKRQYN